MTNREWILEKMKNMSDEELGKIVPVNRFDEIWCNQNCFVKPCSKCTCEWLKQEHKEEIKLSEAERVILENIDKQCKWIARDKNNTLCVYETEPKKDSYFWCDGNYTVSFEIFNHLFQFVSWEDDEPYNIEELLK